MSTPLQDIDAMRIDDAIEHYSECMAMRRDAAAQLED